MKQLEKNKLECHNEQDNWWCTQIKKWKKCRMSLKVTGTFGCELTALIVPNATSSLQTNKHQVSASWLKTGMIFSGVTRTRLRSRRGQRPQNLQLGLQGDPLLVNHLQPPQPQNKHVGSNYFTITLSALFSMSNMVEYRDKNVQEQSVKLWLFASLQPWTSWE